jgi:DNA polymerase kappa
MSTCSYEARKFGVSSAMPAFVAMKLCPHLNIVKSHYGRYKEASALIHATLAKYDPLLASVGLDEAYLDLGLIR